MAAFEDVEGLAAELLDEGGFGDCPDPWKLIASFGARVVRARPGERPHAERRVDGGWDLVVHANERPERVAATAVHELAHPLLVKADLTNDEAHAWRLTGALMLPRAAFLRRVRACGGQVERVAAAYPHVSHEMLARRIVDLGEGRILHVWDVEPAENHYRVVSPGWRWHLRQPTPIEHETMTTALEARAAVELVGGVRAWCVQDAPWLRVLCLSDGEVVMGTLTDRRAERPSPRAPSARHGALWASARSAKG